MGFLVLKVVPREEKRKMKVSANASVTQALKKGAGIFTEQKKILVHYRGLYFHGNISGSIFHSKVLLSTAFFNTHHPSHPNYNVNS